MERNYKKLEIEEFGKILLGSNDLDPVYVALYECTDSGGLDTDHLSRILLAYILCYHVGASCWISERKGEEFWDAIETSARNVEESPVGGRWPRSHERRHWRGQFAIDVVDSLKLRYGEKPENFILYLIAKGEEPGPITFSEFARRVKHHHGFGDWAAFKLADLVDRLGIAPVDFSYNDVVIYKDPVEAAKMLFCQRHAMQYKSSIQVKPAVIQEIFDYLINYFREYSAPPIYERSVGLQEVETILCKWKSHRNGRYPLYNDIREIQEGLVNWSKISETAKLFNQNLPVVSME
jgi:hypothetical protein